MKNKTKKYLDKKISINKYRNIFILGGTGEIGFSLVEELIYKNVNVILGARDLEKYQELKANLLDKYPNAQIDYVKVDLLNEKSILEASFILKASNIDCVILNSGIASNSREENMKVNYYSIMYFINLLGPQFKYIVASSISIQRYFKEDTSKKEDSYSYSKYLLYMYCKELNEEGYDITSIHPGIVFTNLFVGRHIRLKILFPLLKRILISKDKAALTFMYALSYDVDYTQWVRPSGLFQIFGYPKASKIK